MGTTRQAISDDEHETEMAQFSEMIEKRIHPDFAVAAALDHCDRHGRVVPQWLVGPAAKLMCRLLNDKVSKPAKNATPSALYIKNMRDWMRWDLMDEFLGVRRHTKKEIKKLSAIASSPKKYGEVLATQREILELAGPHWNDVLQQVSARLQGTFARGGEQTIKKSYTAVVNATGELGLHYHRFHKSFLDLVGIDIELKNKVK